jgi:hypothetical protein
MCLELIKWLLSTAEYIFTKRRRSKVHRKSYSAFRLLRAGYQKIHELFRHTSASNIPDITVAPSDSRLLSVASVPGRAIGH